MLVCGYVICVSHLSLRISCISRMSSLSANELPPTLLAGNTTLVTVYFTLAWSVMLYSTWQWMTLFGVHREYRWSTGLKAVGRRFLRYSLVCRAVVSELLTSFFDGKWFLSQTMNNIGLFGLDYVVILPSVSLPGVYNHGEQKCLFSNLSKNIPQTVCNISTCYDLGY